MERLFVIAQQHQNFDAEGNYLYFQRSRAEYDISIADYIICVPSDAKSEVNDHIKAVVNPFKK
jgi:hypothetical protein